MRPIYYVAIALLVSACGRNGEPSSANTDPATEPAAPPPSMTPAPNDQNEGASAAIAPTEGNAALGSLTLAATAEGVHIVGTLENLAPNAEFGFHVHEHGDCSAPDASSAGGHFNPENQPHGNPQSDARHAGDMLNARSDAKGVAHVDVTAAKATLRDGRPTDVLGKAIVVHAKPDDYASQPSGNAGDRIACGVIKPPTPALPSA